MINLPAQDLLNTRSLQILNLNQLASNSVILFNVRGSPCGAEQLSLEFLRPFASSVIWNFIGCSTLTIRQIDLIGTVLAVDADVVDSNNGHLTGQLFAKSFNGTLEVGEQRFEGCIPSNNPTSSTSTSIPETTDDTPPQTTGDTQPPSFDYWPNPESKANSDRCLYYMFDPYLSKPF